MLHSILDVFGSETDAERTTRDLQALDDRQLADLGLSRDQIPMFVKEHTDREVA